VLRYTLRSRPKNSNLAKKVKKRSFLGSLSVGAPDTKLKAWQILCVDRAHQHEVFLQHLTPHVKSPLWVSFNTVRTPFLFFLLRSSTTNFEMPAFNALPRSHDSERKRRGEGFEKEQHKHQHAHHHHDPELESDVRVNRQLFLSDAEADDCTPSTVCVDPSCEVDDEAPSCHTEGEHHSDVADKCPEYEANNLIRRHAHACQCEAFQVSAKPPPRAPRPKKRASRLAKPRTRTAYQVFAKEEHARLAGSGLALATRTTLISRQWKALDLGQRSQYERWAEQEREEMKRQQEEVELRYISGSWGLSDDQADRIEATVRQLRQEGYYQKATTA
jgi:hypothetical protein